MHTFIDDCKRAEAEEATRIRDAELAILAEEVAAPPLPEQSFEIIIRWLWRKDTTIQVLSSSRVHHLKQIVSDATGLHPNAFILVFDHKTLHKMRLISHYGIQEGACVQLLERSELKHSPRAYVANGFNRAAAHLLLSDVRQFEHLARKSWSAQRVKCCEPFIFYLIGRLFSIMLPSHPSLQHHPIFSPPQPSPSWRIANQHQLLVFSGWTMATVRGLSRKYSNCEKGAIKLLLRRVLGAASVLRLAAHEPLTPPPPGTRASNFCCGHPR
jgi:hypothetical protein